MQTIRIHTSLATRETRELDAVRLRISPFGRMDVRDNTGASLLPRSRKTRAVLAVLALAAPRPVLRDQLAGLLWSMRDREQARASLRQAVHELQTLLQRLGPVLQADRNHLSLRTPAVAVDLRPAGDADATLLEDLAGLDPAFDRWLVAERRRLARAAASVLIAELERATRDDADPTVLITTAEQLLAIDRNHEGAWRALMRAHAARGERAAALAAYERCVRALAEHDGAGPSAETRALHESIRREIPARSIGASAEQAGREPRQAPGHRTRLGVMPFRTLNGNEDPLSFGLAEEITAALSRFRWIFLVASPSMAALAADRAGGEARLRSLRLNYLLDGTVQRGREQLNVRINVRLLDQEAGGEVAWAQRFDRDGSDILHLQDEIASATVARIDPELMLREGQRAAVRAPSSLTAYDRVLSAIPAIYRLERTSFRAAGTALAEAVALDPEYAAAHAWWACWHMFLVGQNWATNPEVAMERAGELAERAIALDSADARGFAIAGHVRAFLHHQVHTAIGLHERALSLNPNLPLAWTLSGLSYAYAGQHDEAIRRVHRAQTLSPFDPHAFFNDMALMLPHLLRGDYEQVLELSRRAIALNPALTSTYKLALAANGHLGRDTDAAVLRMRLMQMEPGFTISGTVARTPLLRPQDMALYAEGLRRAGIPE
jgi:DNA-binding SARP family transcriptional activator